MDVLTCLQPPQYLKHDLPLKGNSWSGFHPRTYAQVMLKSEELSSSQQLVLDKVPNVSTFAWNHLIRTHLANGEVDNALCVYQQMLMQGVCPDKHTIPRMLAASHISDSLFLGKQLHGHAVKLGISSEDHVISALMKMYGHLDGAHTAKQVFEKCSVEKNSVCGTLLVSVHLRENKPRLAIDMFYHMVNLGAHIDAVAIITAVSACGMLRSMTEARKVYEIAKVRGLESHLLVCNSLLKMYLDCGSIKDACEVFYKMSSRDIISWTEMIRGYVKNGEFNEGLKLFKKMVSEGIRPDAPAAASILPACARMTAHKQGKEIHGYLMRNGVEMNATVNNALLDMYVKSGCIKLASEIFSGMTCRDAVSWTIMIYGYSLHGQGTKAVELFHEMRKSNYEIDALAYASVLHACVVANLVEEGKTFFSYIKKPEMRHYTLMVSLLAGAGFFSEAKTFMEENRIGQRAEAVKALLDGCRICYNVKEGKKAIEKLCNLEPLNAENYILLSNWYAGFAKWDIVDKLRETIGDLGLTPKKAYSWIEFRQKIHVFGTGDVSHPRSERVYWELQCLVKIMEQEGYTFDSDFSLHDVDEERECIPVGHSEMLAISFGLISSHETTIRVTKNLRVCRNCHAMAKAISRLLDRKIILKDPNCFHHFKDGGCSCGDRWQPIVTNS